MKLHRGNLLSSNNCFPFTNKTLIQQKKEKTGEKFANKKRLKFKNKLVLAGIFICVNNLMFRIITEHCPMSSKYSYFRYIFFSLSFTLCRIFVISQRCYVIKITWHTKKQGFASILLCLFFCYLIIEIMFFSLFDVFL